MDARVVAVIADAPIQERFLQGQGGARGKKSLAVVHHGRVMNLGSMTLVCVYVLSILNMK